MSLGVLTILLLAAGVSFLFSRLKRPEPTPEEDAAELAEAERKIEALEREQAARRRK